MRGFHDLLREKLSSLFKLLGWSSISITPLVIQCMHFDLSGQNTGVLQLDMMAHVYAVFSHSGLSRVVKADMLMVHFDPHLN
jgi:hypothetical protein